VARKSQFREQGGRVYDFGHFFPKKTSANPSSATTLGIHRTLTLRNMFGEYHVLIQELRSDPERFRHYFRMTPDAFDTLQSMVEAQLTRMDTNYLFLHIAG